MRATATRYIERGERIRGGGDTETRTWSDSRCSRRGAQSGQAERPEEREGGREQPDSKMRALRLKEEADRRRDRSPKLGATGCPDRICARAFSSRAGHASPLLAFPLPQLPSSSRSASQLLAPLLLCLRLLAVLARTGHRLPWRLSPLSPEARTPGKSTSPHSRRSSIRPCQTHTLSPYAHTP